MVHGTGQGNDSGGRGEIEAQNRAADRVTSSLGVGI